MAVESDSSESVTLSLLEQKPGEARAALAFVGTTSRGDPSAAVQANATTALARVTKAPAVGVEVAGGGDAQGT